MFNFLQTEHFQMLATEMVGVIKSFHAKRWALATSTNYSYRAPDSEYWAITQSGLDKEYITEEHFIIMDPDGLPTDERKPSAETQLHTFLYKQSALTQAVLHTHSAIATALTHGITAPTIFEFQGFEMAKAIPGITSHTEVLSIPVLPNSQDMNEIIHHLQPILTHQPLTCCFLLAGHGLYSWAPTIAIAKQQIEAIEFLLECKSLHISYGRS